MKRLDEIRGAPMVELKLFEPAGHRLLETAAHEEGRRAAHDKMDSRPLSAEFVRFRFDQAFPAVEILDLIQDDDGGLSLRPLDHVAPGRLPPAAQRRFRRVHGPINRVWNLIHQAQEQSRLSDLPGAQKHLNSSRGRLREPSS